jgi:translation initiation factor IF-1
MGKEQYIETSGTVEQALRGGKFIIALENGHKLTGHLSGSMRRHYIKILPGDRVDLEISTYDLTKGRITYRHKGGKSKKN